MAKPIVYNRNWFLFSLRNKWRKKILFWCKKKINKKDLFVFKKMSIFAKRV